MEGRKVVQSPITDIQKECILLNTSAAQNILKGSGITNYEPAVLNQLLTVANSQAMAILHKAKTYSEHLEKTSVDEKDIALAIKMNKQSIAKPPSKKLIKELAEEINSKPLPQIRPHAGLRLPSEQHCMLEERVQMKHQPKSNKIQANQVQVEEVNRSYTMQGTSCIIRHNAESAENVLPPGRFRLLQPKPTVSAQPGRPLKNSTDTPVRMNASITPAPAPCTITSGEFKIPFQPTWKNKPAPTATATREEDFTTLVMEQLNKMDYLPPASVPSTSQGQSNIQGTLIPVPWQILQPLQRIPPEMGRVNLPVIQEEPQSTLTLEQQLSSFLNLKTVKQEEQPAILQEEPPVLQEPAAVLQEQVNLLPDNKPRRSRRKRKHSSEANN